MKIIRSKRKTVSLEISNEAELIVRAHPRVPLEYIEKFVKEKQSWIDKKKVQLKKQKERAIHVNPHLIAQYKKQAFEKIKGRLDFYATISGLKYSKFRITNAKSRHGSCNSSGVLSFSWRLIFFPDEVIDYIVVHELTHLNEFNHSRRFWAKVELILPGYKSHRKWLKDNGNLIVI